MRRMLRTFVALLLVGSLGVATPAAGNGLAAGGGVAARGGPAGAGAVAAPAVAGGMQVYGAWHCGNDACTWATVRDMADFDANNHWLIDRGDGRPSVNLVILSFVNPLQAAEPDHRRGRHATACRRA